MCQLDFIAGSDESLMFWYCSKQNRSAEQSTLYENAY
jgi:hypothetical protein